MKRNIVKEIKQIIEEVNHEIRVDLGIEQPTIEVQEEFDPVSDMEKEEIEEEWPEVKSFEKLLDEIVPDRTEFNTILT